MQSTILEQPLLTRAFLLSVCLMTELFGQPATQPSLPANTRLDLFLLIGQSNMAGRGTVEPPDQAPHPRVWVLNQQQQWSPAIDPLHWDRPDRVGVGPGRAFGIAVAEKFPAVTVGLIPAAMGGSSIDQWTRDGELYQTALKRARLAMQHGAIRAILWHQGETDSVPEKLADHPAKLRRLVENLRADLNDPNLPFILGQVGTFHEKVKPAVPKMNQLLMDFAKSMPRTTCVSAQGLTQKGDDTHFDSAAARELGKRYAQAYFDLAK